jgi:hypothetical protein
MAWWGHLTYRGAECIITKWKQCSASRNRVIVVEAASEHDYEAGRGQWRT